MNCPNCQSEVKDGMRFCPNCGNEIPEKRICPSCGSEITDTDMQFCKNCGSSLPFEQSKTNYSQLTDIDKKAKQKKLLNSSLLITLFFIILLLGYFGFSINSNVNKTNNTNNHYIIDNSEDNNKRAILINYSQEEDESYLYNFHVTKCESNYPNPAFSKEESLSRYAYSGIVTVPYGEIWVYDHFEFLDYYFISENGMKIKMKNEYLPIVYYGSDIESINIYRTKHRTCSREYIPDFYEGEKFRIGIRIPTNATTNLRLKVYFKNKGESISSNDYEDKIYSNTLSQTKKSQPIDEITCFIDENSLFQYLEREYYSLSLGRSGKVVKIKEDKKMYCNGECQTDELRLIKLNPSEAWLEGNAIDESGILHFYINREERILTIENTTLKRSGFDK